MNRSDKRRKRAAQRKRDQRVQANSVDLTKINPIFERIKSSALLTKIKMLAKTDQTDGLSESYDGLAGCGGKDVLLGSNLVERTRIREAAGRPMRTVIRQPNIEIAVQMEPVQLSGGSAAMLDIGRAKTSARVFKKTGIASVSGVALYGFPDVRDELRFGILVVVWTVFWGENIRPALEAARARGRTITLDPSLPKATFEWLPPGRKIPLKEALDQLFCSRSFGWPIPDDDEFAAGIAGWTKASFARKRAFTLFQTLSMIAMEWLFFGFNEGEVLMKPIINGAKLRLKSRKVLPTDVHRDAVAHFWWRELRRLGLSDLTVPLIKLR